jgi:hypothetical protein
MARSIKFVTVMGASFSYSLAVTVPIDVTMVAYRPGSSAGFAGTVFLAAAAFGLAGFGAAVV